VRVVPRTTGAVIAVSLLAGVVSLAAAGASANMTDDMLHMINRKREAHGMHDLRLGHRVTRRARAHTRRMIRRNELFHSRTVSPTRERRITWGENVGCARSTRRLFRALMHSPLHRANILHRGFHRAGLGVLESRGRNICGRHSIWTTQIFLA
jgi:uncharacterized protein YkwD